MRGERRGERALPGAFGAVQTDGLRIMGAHDARDLAPLRPGISAHRASGEVGKQAWRHWREDGAQLLREPEAIILAGEDHVDRLGMGRPDDAAPDRPEVRILVRHLRHDRVMADHPAIREQLLHPLQAQRPGHRIVGQRADEDGELVDQEPRGLAEMHMAGMGRHELAEDEAVPHAGRPWARSFRHQSVKPMIERSRKTA